MAARDWFARERSWQAYWVPERVSSLRTGKQIGLDSHPRCQDLQALRYSNTLFICLNKLLTCWLAAQISWWSPSPCLMWNMFSLRQSTTGPMQTTFSGTASMERNAVISISSLRVFLICYPLSMKSSLQFCLIQEPTQTLESHRQSNKLEQANRSMEIKRCRAWIESCWLISRSHSNYCVEETNQCQHIIILSGKHVLFKDGTAFHLCKTSWLIISRVLHLVFQFSATTLPISCLESEVLVTLACDPGPLELCT